MFGTLLNWVAANIWYLLLALFAVWNVKGLPFVWHARLYSILFKHIVVQKSTKVSFVQHGGSTIFEPIITQTSCPLLEIDANLHKSNSTFYLDLDINRAHLMATLFKPVLSSGIAGNPCLNKKFGRLNCIIGAVSCHFRRDIKPLEKYEIWTRVLCWDKKWLYVVSHFVTAGKVVPLRSKISTSACASKATDDERSEARQSKIPFYTEDTRGSTIIRASAITKYVFKEGRRTIPPAEVMLELGLIPSPPEAHQAVVTQDELPDGKAINQSQKWDWHRIQQENERGLKIANHFLDLDSLHETFSGDSSGALGYVSDWPW